eukprot:scaffold226847_cov36-Tisochrysis_lutea.AAC.5
MARAARPLTAQVSHAGWRSTHERPSGGARGASVGGRKGSGRGPSRPDSPAALALPLWTSWALQLGRSGGGSA